MFDSKYILKLIVNLIHFFQQKKLEFFILS